MPADELEIEGMDLTETRPRQPSGGSRQVRTAQRAGLDAGNRENPRPSTILVVEDEANMLDIVSLILEDAGYRVLQATNGQGALSVLQMIKPGLIVSDVMMPDLDGFAFCEQVRANVDLCQIPFVFLTAKGERTSIRYAMQLGADDCLVKPFEPDELLSIVETRLARAAETQAYFERVSADVRKLGIRALSHELRTPLSLIFGYTELLKATGPQMEEEDLQAILHGLFSGTRRMMSLVEDFLLLSRLETGLFAEEIGQTPYWTAEPDEVVGHVADEHKNAASARRVALILRLGASATAIAINEASLREIIWRLVDNAIKFSKQGGGRAILITRQDGDFWVLEVADDGIGIRRDALREVFEPFRQVDRDRMEQQGAGLGLAIVRGLADVFGGRVAVESQPRRGSRFTVHLPLAVEDRASPASSDTDLVGAETLRRMVPKQ
jgi:two-component system sensor histidine kinase/response regulator